MPELSSASAVCQSYAYISCSDFYILMLHGITLSIWKQKHQN